MTLLTLIAVIVIIALAVSVALAVMRSRNKRYGRSFNLLVQNNGNMRSRYELQSNDPSGLMVFTFMLNGASLGPAQGVVAKAGATPASAKDVATSANQKMQSARYSTNQFTQTIGGLLYEVGYVMPGALGQTLRNLGAQVRGVDNQIQRVQLQAGRVTRMATIATDTADMVGRVVPGQDGKSEEKPLADDRTMTPYIEPGGQLQVQMMVAPADPRNVRSTSFTVLSRSTETHDAEVVMQQGVIDYSNLSDTRYIVSYLLIGAVTLAALWFVLFGVNAWGR